MKRMNRLWVGLGASMAVIAVVAGVTLGITTLLGVTFEESEPKPAEGVQTGRYPGLSICVQAIGVDASLEAIGQASVETALLEVMQHPYWKLFEPDAPPPFVEIGCPSEPLPARPGLTWKNAQIVGGTGTIYTVPEAGFHKRFVFIMSLEQIDQLLGGLSIRLAPQEFVVYSGDTFGAETHALYVTPEELQDSAFMLEQLLMAVGIKEAPY